jgi:hypothetical protein
MVEGVNPPWNNSNKRLPERLKLKSPKLVRLACEADKAARKRHASPRDRCDGSGTRMKKLGMSPPLGGTTQVQSVLPDRLRAAPRSILNTPGGTRSERVTR